MLGDQSGRIWAASVARSATEQHYRGRSTHTHIFEPETQCNDHGQEDPEAGQGEPSGPEGRVWWFDVCAGNDPASARRSVDDHFRREGDANEDLARMIELS
jgi:hypothetical protein